MGIHAFIPRAFALSLPVFLRYLPFFILYLLIIVGLLLSTDNPWVIGLILFILGTYGAAFLMVTGIRGGLVTLKATAPPTAGGLLNSTTRVLFFHLLLQAILGTVLLAGVGALFYYLIGPAMAPDAMGEVLGAFGSAEEGAVAPTLSPTAEAQLTLPLILFSLSVISVFGFLVGIFGVPMAAVSANAVEHSPKHDMIYGMAQFLPHQMLLYVIAMGLPIVVTAAIVPASLVMGPTAEVQLLGTTTILSLLYSVYSPCIVYAGMALAYREYRSEVARQRAAESRPEIDYEAERENLRSLRQNRTTTATGTKYYDPNKVRDASDADEQDL